MKTKKEEKRGPGRPRKYPVTEKKEPIKDSLRKPTRVKPKVTKFDEIIRIADNEMKNYLRTLNTDIIFASLQGADEAVMDKVLSNITKRSLLSYEMQMEAEPDKYNEKQVSAARKMMIKPFINR